MVYLSFMLVAAAMTAATAPKLTVPIRFYACVFLAVNVVLESCQHVFGFSWDSLTYKIAYAICTFVALVGCAVVVYYYTEHLARPLAVAIGLALLAFWGTPEPWSFEQITMLLEGATLVFLGLALKAVAPGNMRLVALTTLWFLLAGIDFTIAMNGRVGYLAVLDAYGPYLVSSAAFLVIAGLSYWEQYSQQERQT